MAHTTESAEIPDHITNGTAYLHVVSSQNQQHEQLGTTYSFDIGIDREPSSCCYDVIQWPMSRLPAWAGLCLSRALLQRLFEQSKELALEREQLKEKIGRSV
jgi:hypothetical protein